MDGSLNMLLICSLVANGNDETPVFLSNFCIAITRMCVRGEAPYPAVSASRATGVLAGRAGCSAGGARGAGNTGSISYGR